MESVTKSEKPGGTGNTGLKMQSVCIVLSSLVVLTD